MMLSLGHKLFKLIDVMSMPLMKICPLPNGCSSNEYMKKNHILKYSWLSCFNQLKIACFGIFCLVVAILTFTFFWWLHTPYINSQLHVVHIREWLLHVHVDLHIFQLQLSFVVEFEVETYANPRMVLIQNKKCRKLIFKFHSFNIPLVSKITP